MNTIENIRQALRNVKANLLRTILTLLIIAFGILALIGILTAIDSFIYSLNDNFSSLGTNSFTVTPKGASLGGTRHGRREKSGDPITFDQAIEFQERFEYPAKISIDYTITGNAVIKHGNEETNPNVVVVGINEFYLDINGYDFEEGRNFSGTEHSSGASRIILGKDIVEKLFEGQARKAIGKTISVGSIRYLVVGVYQSKGASLNQSGDRMAFVPLVTAKGRYATANSPFKLSVAVNNAEDMEDGISTAIGLMRNIRKLKSSQDNDFEITKSDNLISIIRDNTVNFRLAAIGIALITLLGAAIGLMNIMLVSVTERTREVGISKAVGATSRNILVQFLTEAVVICQLGGIVGIIFGVMVGYLVTYLLGGSFVMPWGWIIFGIIVCFVVGVISGLYPAIQAAKLDPVEALRYE